MVILYILAGLLFIYLSGLYVTNILFKNNQATSLNLVVGYIATQLLFLMGIYAVGPYTSLYSILSLFIVLTFINIKSIKEQIININFKTISILFILIALIGFDFIYYGIDGYWHTASEDCFDAINGKDYILGNFTSFGQISTNGNVWQDKWQNILDTYLYSDIVIQYTSVTFWSLLFNMHSNLDFFLIQSIINLIMMFFGIVLLSREIFKFNNTLAYLIAFASVFSSLYLTTYFNTHQGSMMFGAVMPFILYLFFKYEETKFQDKKLLFLLILSSIFLLFTYKHPFVFFLAPAIVYIFKNKIKIILSTILSNKIYLALILFVIIGASIYMYGVLEYYLNFRDSRFRSWGISLEPEMLIIYWGFTKSMGAYVQVVYHNLWLKYTLYAIVYVYMLITLFGYFKFSKKFNYFKYFIGFWILFFIVFKYLIADPYYFYKFLYTTQFVFMIFFIYGLKILYEKRRLKIFSIIIFISFFLSNITNNIYENNRILNELFNKNNFEYKQITKIPNNIIKESFLEIPKQNLKQIAQVNLRKNKLFTKLSIDQAKYIVLMKNIDDVYFDIYNNNKNIVTVYEDKIFKVIEKPKYYLSLYGPWESEVFISTVGNFSNIPFRWVSHGINGGKIFLKIKTNKRYLQTCFESGPSIGFGEFDINIDDKKYILQGVDCEYFELDNSKSSYIMYSTVKGKAILPFDGRALEYKIANIKNVNIKYDTNVLELLNPENDIANQDFNKSNNILVGNGWYPQELVNMRWGSDNVELLVMNSTMENIKVEFDIEVGPSLKAFPLKIEILNDEDIKIGYIEVQGRQKVILNLKIQKDKRYQILKLNVLNDTKKLEFDPRNLNFKVFSMKVVK
jgi:hypothetical protein